MMGLTASHLSREFFGFLKQMSEVVYRQEEQKLIAKEVLNLKTCFEKSAYTPEEKKELIIRAIYVEMFGYEVPFARIHAINLVQEKNISAKLTGYLACALLIPPNDDIILLLVNTIQKDLSSHNYLEVSAALTSICQLEKKEMIQATLPLVLNIIDNPMSNLLIKKKAYIAAQKFQNYVNQYPSLVRKCIEDQDISIMFIGLNLLQDLAVIHPSDYSDLVPKLVEILRLIITKQLSHELDYYGTPAPWIQIAILNILGLIGASNTDCSEHIQGILLLILKSNENISKVALAVLLQCILTLSKIQSSPSLVELASTKISKFITSNNSNLKYMAIVSLSHIAEINPQCVLKHQLLLVDSLNDPDETISRKTLDIVFRMTNETNIKAIVDTLITSLEFSRDLHYKKDLIYKVALVSEKYFPNAEWYLDTLISILCEIEKLNITKSQTIEVSKIALDISNQLFHLVSSENSESFKSYILQKFESLLDSESKYLQKLCTWAIGEYGDGKMTENIAKMLQHDIATELDGYLITALVKMKTRGCINASQITIGKLITSDYSLSQRINECKYILNNELKCLNYKLPEGFETKTKFLNKIAEKALESGAKPYNVPKKFEKKQEFTVPCASKYYEKIENLQNSPPEDKFEATECKFMQQAETINTNNNARWGPDGYKWSKAKEITSEVYEKSSESLTITPNTPLPSVVSKEKNEEREKRAAALFGGLTLK